MTDARGGRRGAGRRRGLSHSHGDWAVSPLLGIAEAETLERGGLSRTSLPPALRGQWPGHRGGSGPVTTHRSNKSLVRCP